MGAGKVANAKGKALVEENEEDEYDEEREMMEEFDEDEEDEDEDIDEWDEEDMDEEGEDRKLTIDDLDGMIDKEDLMRQLDAMGLTLDVRMLGKREESGLGGWGGVRDESIKCAPTSMLLFSM